MIDVSVIIACYNGASMLEARVKEFESVFQNSRWSWEFLLCDDGSTDATAEIGRRLAQAKRNRFFTHSVNRGRGHAVRAAIPESRGRFVGYVDVDQSTAASYILPVLSALETGFDVAQANRTYRLDAATFPFIVHRYVAHKTYRWLVQKILGLKGHDTETGFKFFRRNRLIALSNVSHAPGWFWDTELIANAHRLGFQVAEIPSTFIRNPRTPSTLHLASDSVRQLRQLLHYAEKSNWRRLTGSCCRLPPKFAKELR